MSDLETWFISTAKKYIAVSYSIRMHNQKLIVMRNTAETNGNKKEARRINKLYRSSYFDNIRVIDEFLYIIGQYLPILIKGPKFKNTVFTNTVCSKINEFYKDIMYPRPDMHPKTASEHNAVNSLEDTLATTGDIVFTLL
jgi:hypothetical protein